MVKADPPLIHEAWYRLQEGCLPSAPPMEHKRYLGRRKRWQVRLPR